MNKLWEEIYAELKEDLKLNFSQDSNSAELLHSYHSLSDIVWNRVLRLSGKRFLIIGNAENFSGHRIPDLIDGNTVIVVADSAIDRIGDYIVPHIIVTDLDGNLEKITKFCMQGSIIFIHSHGDNMDKIRKFVPGFRGLFIPTCQNCNDMYNPEGFTDGDRAVKISERLGASEIILAGFDFTKPYGKGNPDIKKRKLEYARRIIAGEIERGVKIRFVQDIS